MPDYVMVMMGSTRDGDWDSYIEKLIDSGKFRGGSSLGNGTAFTESEPDSSCLITGFMRFSADDIDEIKALLEGNPHYEAGGRIELLEEIPD